MIIIFQEVKGPTGPQGPIGPIGPIGETGATGATGADGEKGEDGATGATGADGEKGENGATGATGADGEKGETGATGATGRGATVTVGTTESVDFDKPAEVINSGDTVDAVLNFKIPRAQPIETIIPFSANESITPVTNAAGVLTRTNLIGNGICTGNISVSDGSFELGGTTDFVVFPMPYDGTITAVSGAYATTTGWTAPCNMGLYVAVAVAKKDEKTFNIIEESKAIAPDYEQSVHYPTRELRYGLAENLRIKVLKGDRIGFIAGYKNSGTTSLARTLPFNFTGSISIINQVLEDEPENDGEEEN